MARANAGIGNPNHISDADLRNHFSNLLRQLVAAHDFPAGNIASVFAGIAGVTSDATAERMRSVLADCGLRHAVIGVDHDIHIALAGGLAGRPGIALIVGTGSSCYGRDADGHTWQTGGWGSLISDEGSGYFLAREAMTAAVRMADGRQPETRLRQAVFNWLGINDVSEIMDRIFGKELSRPQIAAFAPALLQLATDDDPAALGILASGAQELAEMVAANHACLHTADSPEIVITGGLGTADSTYRSLITSAITRQLPDATVRPAEMDAAAGAAMLALQQHTGTVAPEIVLALKGSA
jgi:N-acetylglucosamine kinase-like BadF-type ATPase